MEISESDRHLIYKNTIEFQNLERIWIEEFYVIISLLPWYDSRRYDKKKDKSISLK